MGGSHLPISVKSGQVAFFSYANEHWGCVQIFFFFKKGWFWKCSKWELRIYYFFFFLFPDCYIPSGITGKMLEPIPAAYGQWQGTPPKALAESYVSIWGLGTLLKGTSTVFWVCPSTSLWYQNTIPVMSTLGLEHWTLCFSAQLSDIGVWALTQNWPYI